MMTSDDDSLLSDDSIIDLMMMMIEENLIRWYSIVGISVDINPNGEMMMIMESIPDNYGDDDDIPSQNPPLYDDLDDTPNW